jgi:hypothetical protein
MSEPVPCRASAHLFAVGTTITVFRFGKQTVPFIEGLAVIKSSTLLPDCYEVQFVGELTIRRRFVYHELQNEPERMLAMLLSLWRAENAASADITDFFPDDNLQTRG